MDTLSRFIIPGVVFVMTLAFGLWLSHSGKPYNVPLFNVHKLIALAAVIFTGIQTLRVLKVAPAQALLIALLVLAGLCAVALFATGALMSLDKPAYGVLRTVHNVAALLAVIAMALAAYLLTGRT